MSTSWIYSYDKINDLMMMSEQSKQYDYDNILEGLCIPHNVPALLMGLKTFKFKVSESSMIPHIKKEAKGGEDAFFVCENKIGLGVADGVGGWNEFGVNPSLYAKSLMENCKQEIEKSSGCCGMMKSGEEYLTNAYEKCKKIEGSSTALLCVFQSGSLMEICNIGDSAAMILRKSRKNGKYVQTLKTIEQQHYFPVPYQLAGNITHFVEKSKAKNRTIISDTPKDCNKYYVNTQKRDIVILGTDGLWDNVFDAEIIKIVNSVNWSKDQNDDQTNLKWIADELTKTAKEKSIGTDLTPFETKCKMYRNESRSGGKQDDVTVVVALIDECT